MFWNINFYYSCYYTGGSNLKNGYLENVNLSTTGNECGIYDFNRWGLSQCVIVAAYVVPCIEGGTFDYPNYGGRMFDDGTQSTKYKTVYLRNNNGSYLTLYGEMKGDAVYEVCNEQGYCWFGGYKGWIHGSVNLLGRYDAWSELDASSYGVSYSVLIVG